MNEPHLICMAGVEPTDIRWLWPGRIPLGRMTLMVGRPGCGKSFLTAYAAGTVSTGRAWCDGTPCPRGSVVLCSAEDDPADTIAPRLIAHDADRARVHLLAGVTTREPSGTKSDRCFTLADLPTLRATLDRVGDCKLIVVDPIGSYLGGRVDAHRDNEIRSVLAPAAKLAEEHGAALLVVAHTRKSAAAFADDTALGSRAFTGLARSVLHVMADPDDAERKRRLLLPGKNNLSEPAAGLGFSIGKASAWTKCAAVLWDGGEVTVTADDVVTREPEKGEQTSERADAADWLRDVLADGPLLAKEVQERAKHQADIAPRTLARAKKDAGVEAYRPENPGPWYWRLPGTGAECQGSESWHSGILAFCPDDPENGGSDE